MIELVINKLRPNTHWACDGNTFLWETDSNGVEVCKNVYWFDGTIPPSRNEVEEAINLVEQELKSSEYKALRRAEYPPLADLADAIYWQSQGDESKMVEYLAAVESVKQKYPKE